MKTKNLFKTIPVIIVLIAFIFIMGCGKSEKEVKMTSGEKSSDKKGSVTLKVDTSASVLNWLGKKVTGQHTGTIKIAKGEIGMDNGKVVSGSFDIDMKTIVDLDLTDKEFNNKLITHLKSEDFFTAEKFPFSKFEITKVEPLSDPAKPEYNHTVSGNLTIKGISKGISFPAGLKFENGTLTAIADFDIDRTEWDLKYGSGKFFENLGDKMINDKFNISFKLIAK